jgi:hypothetical protein
MRLCDLMGEFHKIVEPWAGGLVGVQEHGRFAPVELSKQRIKVRISEIAAADVREQRHTIEFECVKRILDFAHRRLRIQQWQRGKGAKSVRVIGDHASRIFITLPCQRSRIRCPGEGCTRQGERDDRRLDPRFIHHGHRFLGGPCQGLRLRSGRMPALCQCIYKGRGQEVVVDVDSTRRGV